MTTANDWTDWMPTYRIDKTGLISARGAVVLVRDQDGDVWFKAEATRLDDAVRLAQRWIDQKTAAARRCDCACAVHPGPCDCACPCRAAAVDAQRGTP